MTAQKGCVSFLGLTQPANYESQAQEFESLIHEHVSCTQLPTNSMLRHKLAIWCSWRPVGQKSAVVWKFLPWDSLLILLLFWLTVAFLQILHYMNLPSLLYTSHVYIFNHEFSSFGIVSNCLCCWLCQMRKKSCCKTGWPWNHPPMGR